MIVRYTDANEDPNRKSIIEDILPKQTIISSILEPSIESRLFGIIAKCVREELEIYRKYPKRTALKEVETAKEETKDFDPRHPKTCFMGKAFKNNYKIKDYELVEYRKAVGTIPHPIWGDCTLLEIWGGDHIADHKEMVLGAFKYGAGLIKNCPPIKVHINPLFQNKNSGLFTVTEEEKEEQEYMETLMAKALFFGVKEPKKRR